MRKLKEALILLFGMALPVVFLLSVAMFVVGCGGGGSSGGDKENDSEAESPDEPGTDPDPEPEPEPTLSTHEAAFTLLLPDGYEGTASCLVCHEQHGEDFMATGHWLWEGVSTNIEGRETEVHGKTDLINNFCIAIPSNEGRCTQCHAGYGWKDDSYDLGVVENIDCLVCHDGSGTYAKDLTTGGLPKTTVDLQTVAMSVGKPDRKNCGACHFFAGGGDNVKHGDLASSLVSTTRDKDVHMGTDGGDFSCQTCHKESDHGIAGMPLHSVNEGKVACTDCHGTDNVHDLPTINDHMARIACVTCHIPAFSREKPTKMEWYWDEAGQDIAAEDIPVDQYGMPLYNKKKGRFVYGMNVRPALRWFNGKWKRKIIGADETYEDLPVVLAEPVGSKDDPNSKIYPFKMMTGRQPADPVNKILLVPHLFGGGPGPNPYWAKYDWGLALAEGAAYAGQNYSGTFEFVDTVMYLTVNHEIAPKEQALQCTDCHGGGIDFQELGYDEFR